MQPFGKLLGANPNHIITYKGELNMCDYCKNREDEENRFMVLNYLHGVIVDVF